jgi:hypothetical protein
MTFVEWAVVVSLWFPVLALILWDVRAEGKSAKREPSSFFRPVVDFLREPSIPSYLTAAFTLLLALFAYYAWDEATHGTRTLQGQLSAMREEQRPWVKADIEIASDLTFSSSSGYVTIRYKVKNVGRSPAFNLNALA